MRLFGLFLTISVLSQLLVLPALSQADQETHIAVIAHPDVPRDDLSLAEVRQLLLGDRQFWNAKLPVTLLIRAPVARERDVVLNRIYQMSEAQFQQYWIAKVFRAEAVSGPKIVFSGDMAAQLVRSIPGSITFVDSGSIPPGVKALKIEGLLPGEKGYPLH